jgi:hypothetical protein
VAAQPDLSSAGGEEGVNMWGPHVNDRGERRQRDWKAQTKGESAFA